MKVLNIHERVLNTSVAKAGELIDQLASPNDQLWPRDRWPAMRFDRSLEVGAKGGHGPIRYFVEAYDRGRGIVFRFTGPKGFQGVHRFEIEEISPESVRLRHAIEMRILGPALFSWPLIFKPMHDALIEDALDKAEMYVTSKQMVLRRLPLSVRFLRRVLSRRSRVSRRASRR